MWGKTFGTVLMTCAFGAAAPTAASATTYDAFSQFDIASGGISAPNFQYGYTPKAFTGSVTPFTIFESPNCGGDGNLICAHLSPTIADALGIYKPTSGFDADGIYAPGFSSNHFENGFLNLHPAHDYWGYAAAVQFIAPTDGDFSFSGLFRNMDNGQHQRGVSAYIGTVNEFTASLYSADQGFSFTAGLLAGQTVTFLVDAGNDNYFNDTTGLQLRVASLSGAVPEPASWAMMIGGLALVGASMRARKATASFA